VLERAGVHDVGTLAGRLPDDKALNNHHVLRGSRTVVHERANVLHRGRPAGIAPHSGTSAVMPRWSDLRVHVSVDFDASSAITVAFAVSAFWLEPVPYGGAPVGQERDQQAWPTRVFIVDQRSVAVERRELLAFLSHLDSIFSLARSRDPDSTFQVYLWDQLQLRHLARVIGRHLPAILADPSIRDMAWLFPSDELVPDPRAARPSWCSR
jgi:DNA replication ATP-dependent helicase Dna2